MAQIGVKLFEKEAIEELEKHIASGVELKLEDDGNFKGCQALLYILQEKEGMDTEIRELLLQAFERGHMLVRKRVCSFLA